MDFFERQTKAHRNTKLLVFYFAAAVIGVVAAVYLAGILIFSGVELKSGMGESVGWWHPQILLVATLGTLAIVTIGSLTKTLELSQGGSAVAEMLGGQLINRDAATPDERKLLNVVEEMAIASGVPVPQVYSLPDQSINAFAAGHSTNDAVVAVTQGCMKLLTRDELQGVIGHEFSHILNGDMRLNLRLIGLIFGIMSLAIVGRILMQFRSGNSRDRNPLPLLGFILFAIGGIGSFFGGLIQAAISRQREFLADASSVQFTRNPAGLSGALQKIGGLGEGSGIASAQAGLASHMFFADGMRASMFHLTASHPPLEERIRAIDPTWDGKFKPVHFDDPEIEERPEHSQVRQPAHAVAPPKLGELLGIPPVVAGLQAAALSQDSVLPDLGAPTAVHLDYAANFKAVLPEILAVAAHEPVGAVALIYSLLLSSDDETRNRQMQQLQLQTNIAVCQEIPKLYGTVAQLDARAKLPLVNLALPSLRRLSPAQYQEFSKNLQFIIKSDKQIDLFEYAIQKIVGRHLAPQFSPVKKPVAQYYVLKPLIPDLVLLLSALAHVGSTDAESAARAFQLGARQLELSGQPLSPLDPADCGLLKIDAALDRLAGAAPGIKKLALNACAYTVAADGVIQPAEGELLRAIADTLDCPIPPFVQGISAEDAD